MYKRTRKTNPPRHSPVNIQSRSRPKKTYRPAQKNFSRNLAKQVLPSQRRNCWDEILSSNSRRKRTTVNRTFHILQKSITKEKIQNKALRAINSISFKARSHFRITTSSSKKHQTSTKLTLKISSYKSNEARSMISCSKTRVLRLNKTTARTILANSAIHSCNR